MKRIVAFSKKKKHALFTISFLAFSFMWGIGFFLASRPLVDFSLLERYDPGSPSILYDEQGIEWGRFQLDRRSPIQLRKMPQHLIDAFVSAEDRHFFSHSGVSFKGIFRSVLTNLYHGRVVQGASTITQQLVKLLFFHPGKTFKRKIKEQVLALLVERQFTKEQILETYLNHVYFGSGIYGVEAATQRFWGVKAQDVSIAQSAMLAAIMKSPGNYSPLYYPLSAERRRGLVLGQMKKFGFISHHQYDESINESMGIKSFVRTECAPHLKETIRQELEERFGRQQLYSGGLHIQTTLSKSIQKKAEEQFYNHFRNKLRKSVGPDINGALISMDVSTGGIKALVGGVDFDQSQFNRAIQGKRQQGSVFKPVLYAAAIDEGMSFLDTAVDEPLLVKSGSIEWGPRNYNLEYEGTITLAKALSFSNNIVSAKTILAVGPKKVADLSKRFRITGAPAYPSLALGCVDSTVIDVAGMFNVFANDGVYVKPHYIKWVKNKLGRKIYRFEPEVESVLSSKTVGKVNSVLSMGIKRKKKYSKEWIDSDAINKTGTTNDNRTCWFAASTPELTTVVYAGYDDNRPMGPNVYPIHTGYPIWLGLHKQVPTVKHSFVYDRSLKEVYANIRTGKIVNHKTGRDIFSLLV